MLILLGILGFEYVTSEYETDLRRELESLELLDFFRDILRRGFRSAFSNRTFLTELGKLMDSNGNGVCLDYKEKAENCESKLNTYQ